MALIVRTKEEFLLNGGAAIVDAVRRIQDSHQKRRILSIIDGSQWDFPVLLDIDNTNVLTRDTSATRERPLGYFAFIGNEALEFDLDKTTGPRRRAKVLIGDKRLPYPIDQSQRDHLDSYLRQYGTHGNGSRGPDGKIYETIFGVIPVFDGGPAMSLRPDES